MWYNMVAAAIILGVQSGNLNLESCCDKLFIVPSEGYRRLITFSAEMICSSRGPSLCINSLHSIMILKLQIPRLQLESELY